MVIYHLCSDRSPKRLETLTAPPAEGFLWIDLERGELAQALPRLESLFALNLHEQHRRDLANPDHPPFADCTSEYELLIAPGLTANEPEAQPQALALLFSEQCLVSVHGEADAAVAKVTQRLVQGGSRRPRRPMGLAQQLLSTHIDLLLNQRAQTTARLDEWRTTLLNPRQGFEDWYQVVEFGAHMRRLANLCEAQEDALSHWRDNTRFDLDEHFSVRLNDLLDHVRRAHNFARNYSADIESLVQMHFSAVAHRTNEIMRVLTVISAIFLPLSLIAGIFGMNFEHMPELKHPYAYFFALLGMVALGGGLLLIFRLKRWF